MSTVTYQGGPVISNIEVVTIYFGNTYDNSNIGNWQLDPVLQEHVCKLNNFLIDITDSAYLNMLAEYTPDGKTVIGKGKWIGATFIPFQNGDLDSLVLDDNTIRSMLINALQTKQISGYNVNRCYFVFTPPYVVVKHKGEINNRAYHDSLFLDSETIPYAVVTHPGVNPIVPTYHVDTFHQLTIFASHELAEIITDPTATLDWGWYDTNTLKEISDICMESEGKYPKWGIFHGYMVSTFWSEKNQQCLMPSEDGQMKPPPKCTIKEKRHPNLSGCVIHSILGSTVIYEVELVNSATAISSYNWNVAGATALSPSNGSTFAVQFPNVQGLIVLQVDIIDSNGCHISGMLSPIPLTVREAGLIENLCELRKFIHINYFVNPLWDPLRDLTKTPISLEDIKQLNLQSKHLMQLTTKLTELYNAEVEDKN